jgi:hypothetical protein
MFNADNRTSGRETYNTAIGYQALYGSSTPANNTGQYNTAIGDNSLYDNVSGSSNTAIGVNALSDSKTGTHNTAIGNDALQANASGNRNTAVGTGADVLYVNLNNTTAIGYNAKVGASNNIILGGTGTDAVRVGIGTTQATGTLDVTSATTDPSIHIINQATTSSAGLEIRTAGPHSQYIDFTHSSTNNEGSGTPDFTNRIISNSTTFSLPGITVANATQNVGIGTTPGSTAILELSSTTKAFVLPRMTKAQRNAISPAVEGMLIFQTDFLPGLRVRANGVWYRILDTVD